MAGVGQGIIGGLTGLASGGPVGAGIGLLQGLFGGGSKEDPALRAMRQQQQAIANRLYQFGSSVPGSDPSELFSLAQERGNLGAAQRDLQQRTFANYSPNQGLPASQMLANLGNAGIAQQMALQSGQLQNATQARRQALQEAANVGQGAAGLYRPQQSQLGQMLAQLSQAYAYRQKQRELGQGGGVDDRNPEGVTRDIRKLRPGSQPSPSLPSSDPYWNLLPPPQGQIVPLGGQNPVGGPLGDDPAITALLMGLLGRPGGAPGAAPSAIPGAVGDDPALAPRQQPDMAAMLASPEVRTDLTALAHGVEMPGIAQVLAMLAQAMNLAQAAGGGQGSARADGAGSLPARRARPGPATAPPSGPGGAALPPAPTAGVGDDPYAAAMQQMLTQQGIPGANQPSAVNAAPNASPGLQGSLSPGNEPFGALSTMNQLRQSNGMGRVVHLPGGISLPY